MVCSYIVCHSSISKDKLLIHATVWTNLDVHANSQTSIKTICHDPTYMIFWKKKRSNVQKLEKWLLGAKLWRLNPEPGRTDV